jgi:hypothetical protein
VAGLLEQHPGFIRQLQFLLDWHTSLEASDSTGGFLEAADWQHYLEYTIRGSVREISERICKLGHRDPAKAAARPHVAAPAVVSLPGRPRHHTPAPTSPPTPHWSDGVR